MNVNDVIDAYVIDVMRRLPARERNEIGLELRGLLAEMLAERADGEGRSADDAMVLALLREFGTPAEVATRYRPPRLVPIPPQETGKFALIAIIGLAIQWAISLPHVFDGRLPLACLRQHVGEVGRPQPEPDRGRDRLRTPGVRCGHAQPFFIIMPSPGSSEPPAAE